MEVITHKTNRRATTILPLATIGWEGSVTTDITTGGRESSARKSTATITSLTTVRQNVTSPAITVLTSGVLTKYATGTCPHR